MISEKEVLDALHTLRNVCEASKGVCARCMLRNFENDCAVILNSMGDTHRKLTDWELKDYSNPRMILN